MEAPHIEDTATGHAADVEDIRRVIADAEKAFRELGRRSRRTACPSPHVRPAGLPWADSNQDVAPALPNFDCQNTIWFRQLSGLPVLAQHGQVAGEVVDRAQGD